VQLEYAKKGATGGALMALQAGADLNHKDWTPLHKTAYYNKPEVAKVLLANGAQVNVRGNDGMTPLHRAAEHNKPEVAKVLLANGAQVNVRGNDGMTPLHRAAEHNKPEVAKVLLANGAQVNVRDKYGRTALDRAMGFGRVCACCGASSEIRALLRQHGAKRGGQLEGMGPHGEVAEVAEEPGRGERAPTASGGGIINQEFKG
jgi:hypothetical protein